MEDVILVFEMEVDRTRTVIYLLGDVAKAGTMESLFQEYGLRRIQDQLAHLMLDLMFADRDVHM